MVLNYASVSYNISSNLLAGSLTALPQQVEFAPSQNLVTVNISVTPNHVCGSQSFSISLGATSSVRVSDLENHATIGIVDAEVVSIHTYGRQNFCQIRMGISFQIVETFLHHFLYNFDILYSIAEVMVNLSL